MILKEVAVACFKVPRELMKIAIISVGQAMFETEICRIQSRLLTSGPRRSETRPVGLLCKQNTNWETGCLIFCVCNPAGASVYLISEVLCFL
jgi:hypothetical protein